MKTDKSHHTTTGRPLVVCAVVAAAGAAVLCWSMTPYGLGLGPDSVAYLSAAEHLRKGDGYVDSIVGWNSAFATKPIVSWPPAYPALLAALAFLPPLGAALLVNIVAFALTAFLTGRMVLAGTGSASGAIFATSAVVVSPAMLSSHDYVLSEPLFILLLLLCGACVERLSRDRSVSAIMLAAAVTAAATLTRWIGIAAAVAAVMTLAISAESRRAKIASIGSFACLAGLPVAAWLARNLLVAHQLGVVGKNSLYTTGTAIRLTIETVRDWFVPTVLPSAPAWVAFFLIIVAVAMTMHIPKRVLDQPSASRLWPLLLVIASYIVVLLYSVLTMNVFPIGTRLVSPIFPIAIVVTACLLFARAATPAWQTSRALACRAACTLCVFIVLPATNSARQILFEHIRLHGPGYRGGRWRHADLMTAIRRADAPFPDGTVVFSNEPEALVANGRTAVRSLKAPWSDAFSRPDDLYVATTTVPSIIALFHSDASAAGRSEDASLEGSALFKRVARFDAGCVFAPIPGAHASAGQTTPTGSRALQ